MSEPARSSPLAPLLERLAIFLALFAIVLRWVSGGAGPGINLFIHLLFWVAPALWLITRALDGGATWRFSGAEFPLLAFSIVALISVQRAPHKLPALDQAMAILSFALLFVFLVNAVGWETVVSLFVPTLVALAVYAILQKFLYFPKLLENYDPSVHPPLTEEMTRRIRGDRVFATFRGPNQFAGFLALALPIAAAALVNSRARLVKAIPLALGLAALVLTGSFGASVGLAAGIATFVALWRTRERRRGWVVAAGSAAAGLAILLALFTPLVSKMAEKSFSMHVRRAYWQAAGTTIGRSPLLGVGLDNYQDFYPQDKPETQTETRYAHNDYLQILAETGIVGGVAFAALLVFALRRALSRGEPSSGPSTSLPSWLVPAAGAAGLVGSWMLGGPLAFFDALMLAAAWVGWIFIERRTGGIAAGPAARMGVAAGMAALLVHMTVEFDFYESSVACALFIVLALATMLRPDGAGIRLPPLVCGAAGILLFLVVFPMLTLLVPCALAADSEVDLARQTLQELDAGARKKRSAAQLLDEIGRLSRSAQDHNPLLVDAYRLQAEGEARAWSRLPKTSAAERQLKEETAIQALENAIRINPRSAALHALKAWLHNEFAKFHASLAPPTSMAEARRQEHARLAIQHQELAVSLYPTFAPYHAELGRLLEADGLRPEAAAQYREALRLSDLAARERYPLERMQVDRPVIQKALDDILKPK